jgi:hypothetical protein
MCYLFVQQSSDARRVAMKSNLRIGTQVGDYESTVSYPFSSTPGTYTIQKSKLVRS